VASVPLAATRARTNPAAFDLGHRVTRLESRLESSLGRGTVVWLIGAAVLAIIVQATVTTVRFARQEPGYQTASAPAEGAMVAVRFAPQASMADVGKFLDAMRPPSRAVRSPGTCIVCASETRPCRRTS
jgi:hypothetical protein